MHGHMHSHLSTHIAVTVYGLAHSTLHAPAPKMRTPLHARSVAPRLSAIDQLKRRYSLDQRPVRRFHRKSMPLTTFSRADPMTDSRLAACASAAMVHRSSNHLGWTPSHALGGALRLSRLSERTTGLLKRAHGGRSSAREPHSPTSSLPRAGQSCSAGRRAPGRARAVKPTDVAIPEATRASTRLRDGCSHSTRG